MLYRIRKSASAVKLCFFMWYEVFSGFIKATVGYIVLLVGSGGLSSTFKPIITALSNKFGIDAMILDTYVDQVAAQGAIETVGRSFGKT